MPFGLDIQAAAQQAADIAAAGSQVATIVAQGPQPTQPTVVVAAVPDTSTTIAGIPLSWIIGGVVLWLILKK